MKIKTRLSIQFSIVVLGILMVFSILVYYFSYTSQRAKFRDNLLERAQNTAILLINVVEVDSTLLKKIHQTTKSLEDEEIALTDSLNKLLYGNKMQYLSAEVFGSYSTDSKPVYFSIAEKDGVSYKHVVNNQIYHVYVLAYNKFLVENLHELRGILLWSILFSLWLSITASYFFSKLAIKPISNIIEKVKEINSSKLNSRLDEGKQQDEIEQLSMTFNQMLSELEVVFKSQDQFVSNASHELRTPLAIMIAESDYILSRKRKPDEYIKHLSGLIGDLRRLNQLLNGLLELAHYNRDNVISRSKIRIDEVIFNAIQDIKIKYPGRKILPKIEYPENENDLIIDGNPGLLEIVFKNLIDNACKFSTDAIEIRLSISEQLLIVEISDQGIGIPLDEMADIFKPFNRGTNVRYIGGFGIGLSIVTKIMELHFAEIKVSSIENEGTKFTLHFNKHLN